METLSNGDASSLDELVLRYQAPLVGFFYRALAGHRATAADLVQDTFIRVLRTAATAPGGRSGRGSLPSRRTCCAAIEPTLEDAYLYAVNR
jgi:DNA-directed RNA polymerase specialized sigma24 family protein